MISNNKNPTFIFQKTDLNQEVPALDKRWSWVGAGGGQQGAAATGCVRCSAVRPRGVS